MNTKQRVEAFKEAQEEAEKKARAIVEEAQDTISNLYAKKGNRGVKINVVDALNIDLYYELFICAKYNIVKTYLFIKDIKESGTEEEFGFAFQRLNDLMETAKSNLEKIKHIISKYD